MGMVSASPIAHDVAITWHVQTRPALHADPSFRTMSQPATPLHDLTALLAEADSLRYTDMRGAVVLAAQALDRAVAADDVIGCVHALRIRGGCLARLADLDGAQRDLERAEELLGTTENDGERGWVALMRAHICWRRGEYSGATAAARSALALHERLASGDGQAASLLLLGVLAETTGDEGQALRFFYASHKISEDCNDPGGMAAALTNIANSHGRLGDGARAVAQYARALPLCVAAGNRSLEAGVSTNLGVLHHELGNRAQALAYATEGLRLARDLGDRKIEIDALTAVAEIRSASGEHSQAIALLLEALVLCESLRLPNGEIGVRVALGQVYLARGAHEPAKQHFEAALAIGDRIGSSTAYPSHDGLSTLFHASGDFERAFHHARLYHEAKDARWGAQANQRIRAALIEAEVQQAAEDGRVLREHNEALIAADAEKTRLLASLSAQAVELERLSTEDGLTGVFNRRHLDGRLALEWERARRFEHPLSVALLDIDHFKQVNDQYSHASGDEVLRRVAAYLRSHTRQVDVVARYGGEEFAIVFVETSLQVAASVCELLRAGIAALEWGAPLDALRVTISIGIASQPEVSSVPELLTLADARLYAAKGGGRNRVESA